MRVREAAEKIYTKIDHFEINEMMTVGICTCGNFSTGKVGPMLLCDKHSESYEKEIVKIMNIIQKAILDAPVSKAIEKYVYFDGDGKKHRANKELAKIRTAVADYKYSEGCSCCQNVDGHNKAGRILAKLLNVDPYHDGSGFDFSKYRTKEKK